MVGPRQVITYQHMLLLGTIPMAPLLALLQCHRNESCAVQAKTCFNSRGECHMSGAISDSVARCLQDAEPWTVKSYQDGCLNSHTQY